MKCNRCRSSRVKKRRLRVSTCFGANRTRVGGSVDARPVAPRTRTRANAWVARDGRRKFVDKSSFDFGWMTRGFCSL